MEDNVPIDAKVLSGSIESAQTQGGKPRTSGIRKERAPVRRRDEPPARESSYAQRHEVLDGKDLKEQILKMLRQAVESRVKTYLPCGNAQGGLESGGPEGLLPRMAAGAG